MNRGDYTRTYSADTLRKTTPSYDRERDSEARHRENDARFVKILHMAIWNGENLPAGTPKPRRPLVLIG
jgi:hypothetical protein